MLIGVPKEVKNHEYRVGLLPAGVRELVHHGHEVLVETNAGAAISFDDQAYVNAGARIVARPKDIFDAAELIIKVKEPQAAERAMLHDSQALFTYLHRAPDPAQTHELIGSGATCIAYETVTDDLGRLPLLAPMSEVAGRMSIQAGAYLPRKTQGRQWNAAGRRAGCGTRQCRRHRWWRRRRQRGSYGDGYGGGCRRNG